MRLILFNNFISINILISYCYNFQYHTTYSENENIYHIDWSIDTHFENIQLQICEKFKNSIDFPNWLGIGFSNRGKIENADLFAVNIKFEKGFDLHTNSYGEIIEDNENNYHLKDIFTSHKNVCFIFDRKLNTCDKFDYQIDRGTTNIIILSSKFENINHFGLELLNYFVIQLQLIRSRIPISPISSSTQFMDIQVNNIKIPDSKTTYWCKLIKLPRLEQKHHIIKYEAILKSRGLVHHMELFHCEVPPDDSMKYYNAPCNAESKPMGLTMCRKPFTYPEEVGNPIGGEKFSNYAILEIHYNNPEEKRGIIDNSGLRLYYTDELRQYDAGIIELGLEYTEKNSIPPKQTSFILSGYCLDECTKQALPTNGIFVFGSQLHTHLTGVQVETRHFRNDKELEPLNIDTHYQPHYQEIRLLPKIVNILPGDMLITTCTYNTLNRSEMTFGGIEITNEMCLNYIFYYPRIKLELCKSSVNDFILEQFFEKKPTENLKNIFNNIKWSKNNSKLLERFYELAPIHQSCNMSDSKSFEGHWILLFLLYYPLNNISRRNQLLNV
uniref:Tyramine beta-hydroxylase n=1 Tax=Dugesia japonica TaxID=6161 RepID=B6ZH61_DUGJA|nr:tyramine beta-hydroxylase [Dugesia japonica]